MGFAPTRLYQGTPLALPGTGVGPTIGPIMNFAGVSGTIANGTTVAYRITAIINGVETLPGPETTVAMPGSGGPWAARPVWGGMPGASQYRVYGRTASSELLIATVTASATSTPANTAYTDLGTITPSGALPTSTALVETTAAPGLYRPASGKTAIIRDITVSNPSTFTGALHLSIVPAGGTGGTGNRIVAGVPILPDAAGGPLQITGYWPVGAGGFVTGFVTIPGVVVTISGEEAS